MQYMGGKTRIAKQIAAVITPPVAGGGEPLHKSVLRQLRRRKQNSWLFTYRLQ